MLDSRVYIKIWKSGATTLANKNSGGATHISNGVYFATLDATDTDTVGNIEIFIHEAGALTLVFSGYVYEEAIFDALYASGATGYNTTTPPTAAAIVNEWETQSQADPTGFHVNVLEVAGVAEDLATETKQDTLLGRLTAARAGFLDNLSSVTFKKNTASDIIFGMLDSSNDPITGESVTVQISTDGGALGNSSNAVTEIGGGLYKFTATAGEMNGGEIGFVATSSGAKTRLWTIWTQAA